MVLLLNIFPFNSLGYKLTDLFFLGASFKYSNRSFNDDSSVNPLVCAVRQ